MNTLQELKEWLDKYPDQMAGNPSGICEATGQPYVEFYEYGISRPGDEAVIERHVAYELFLRITVYMGNLLGTHTAKEGRIYWRIPFEWVIADHAEVVRYDDEGPDYDAMTDRKCVKDHNWKIIKAYCRLCFMAKAKEAA